MSRVGEIYVTCRGDICRYHSHFLQVVYFVINGSTIVHPNEGTY